MLKFILATFALTVGLSTVAHAYCSPWESISSSCEQGEDPQARERDEWNCRQFGICNGNPHQRANPTTLWCTARDNRGVVYRVWGKRSQAKSTQVRALEKCQTQSRTQYSCRSIGCSLVR